MRQLTADERTRAAQARRTDAAVAILCARDKRHQVAAERGHGVRKPGEPKGARWD